MTIRTVESESTVLPIRQFKNHNLPLHESGLAASIKAEAVRNQDAAIARKDGHDIKAKIDALSPGEIEALKRQLPQKP